MSNQLFNKFQINRRALKTQGLDNKVRVPKDVSERCWAEIHNKEDIDLMLFDLREEILEEAINICYKKYMEQQNTFFTVHCAAEAFLKLIDWAFYRHDPGAEPTSYPPCYIPKRAESWRADQPPEPSPKDTMARHDLQVLEEVYEDESLIRKWPSNSSIDYPVIEEIPEEYWFPGKVKLPGLEDDVVDDNDSGSPQSKTSSRTLTTSSELLQKVTDYSTGTGPKPSAKSSKSTFKAIEFTKDSSLEGGGDSIPSVPSNLECRRSVQLQAKLTGRPHHSISQSRRSRLASGISMHRSSTARTRSRTSSNRLLPPLEVPATPISDCRLRTLRVDTLYEVSSEIVQDTDLVRLTTKT